MTIRIAFAALGTTALLLTSTAASAQASRFYDIDRNGDGALSYPELESRFGAAAADRIWSRNGGEELVRADLLRLVSNDNDDDDDDGGWSGNSAGRDDNDDDDDGGRSGSSAGRDDNDDDDDDGGWSGRSVGRDDDDDDDGD